MNVSQLLTGATSQSSIPADGAPTATDVAFSDSLVRAGGGETGDEPAALTGASVSSGTDGAMSADTGEASPDDQPVATADAPETGVVSDVASVHAVALGAVRLRAPRTRGPAEEASATALGRTGHAGTTLVGESAQADAEPRARDGAPTTPATPAIPATPAVPAAAGRPATPATPAVPAVPATPAVAAEPGAPAAAATGLAPAAAAAAASEVVEDGPGSAGTTVPVDGSADIAPGDDVAAADGTPTLPGSATQDGPAASALPAGASSVADGQVATTVPVTDTATSPLLHWVQPVPDDGTATAPTPPAAGRSDVTGEPPVDAPGATGTSAFPGPSESVQLEPATSGSVGPVASASAEPAVTTSAESGVAGAEAAVATSPDARPSGDVVASHTAPVEPTPAEPRALGHVEAPVAAGGQPVREGAAPRASSVAARVEAAVEALRSAPPPREATIEVEGMRVMLRLRGDVVHVALDQPVPSSWGRDLGESLASRGLQLGDGAADRQAADGSETGQGAPGRGGRDDRPDARMTDRGPARATSTTDDGVLL